MRNGNTNTTAEQASNPWTGKIAILKIRRNPAGGNVRAFATIRIGEALEIHGVKVIQQPGQTAYVKLPDQEHGGRWFPVVKATDERLQQAISDRVIAAWDMARLGLGLGGAE